MRRTVPRGRSAASRSRASRPSCTGFRCCRSTMFTTRRQLAEFDARIRSSSPARPIEYTVEYKVDGVAIPLIYENGVAGAGGDAGDGTRGDEITNNARTIRGLPLRLQTKTPPP